VNPFVFSTSKRNVKGAEAVDVKEISPVEPTVGEKVILNSVNP
jgi:hypothetical protein